MRARLLALFLGFLFFLPAPAFAGSTTAAKCEDCDVFKRGVNRQVIPTNNLVCIFFVQPKVDKVLLRLDLKDGTSRYYHKWAAGTNDKICVGRWWVENSKSIYICDTWNHAIYEPQHIAVLLKKAILSREAEACLFGKDKCRELGYQVRGSP